MSCNIEMYDQALIDCLNQTLKNGFAEVKTMRPPKKKIYGSRRAIRRVLKARKEQEQGK